MNITSYSHLHLVCITQSSFLYPYCDYCSQKWHVAHQSDVSDQIIVIFLVGLIHFLAGRILLSYPKGFSQVEFLAVTNPLGCGRVQLKKQNVTCLLLCVTYKKVLCFLCTGKLYSAIHDSVKHFNNSKSLSRWGSYYMISLNLTSVAH